MCIRWVRAWPASRSATGCLLRAPPPTAAATPSLSSLTPPTFSRYTNDWPSLRLGMGLWSGPFQDIFHRFESLSQMLRDTFKSVFLKLSNTYFWNIDHCFTPKILKSIHFKRYIKYIFIRVHLWAFPSSRLIRLWSCEHVQGQARSFLSMAPRELWEHQLCRLLGKSKAYTDWIIDGIFLVLDPPRTA